MKKKILICPTCGNIAGLIKESGIPIFCCGKPMIELVPNSTEAATEKHIPVYEKNGNKVMVKVAEVEHPMEEKHYIEWILLETKNGTQIKHLNYTDKPEATFMIEDNDEIEAVYSYCNIHGLWVKEN